MIRKQDDPVSTPTVLARVAVVILAAGRSRRMGVPKALLAIDGVTFLDRIVSVYAALRARPVIVLSSEDALLIRSQLRGAARHAAVVVNGNPDSDRFGSVQCGLSACDTDEFVFLQDVDRPFVSEEVLEVLMNNRAIDQIVSPDVDGHAGHPTLIPPGLVLRLLTEPADRTLREALRPLPRRLVMVPSGDHETNVNTPTDYRQSTMPDDASE